MADPTINDVSDTSLMIAAYRAEETARPDGLFKDPLAGRLSGERGRSIAAAHPQGYITAWMVAVRTVIIDGMIQARIAEGVDTVLNLGAGLDARPYRLDLPPRLRWVEADYPHIIAYKEGVLAGETPRCRLERAGLDLADGERRRRFLAEVSGGAKKILVLTEGVIPYLDHDQAGGLADDLRATEKVSAWIVDYFAPQAARMRGRRFRKRMANAPFKFEPPDWHAFFAGHGWKAGETQYIPEVADRLGRPIPLSGPVKLLFILRALFMGMEARKAGRKFAGYVVLEKA